MRYGVIGTGALGGYYGGLLARNGCEIHFLMRSDADYVRKHGLRVDSKKGDFIVPDAKAYSRVEEMPKCDVLIIAIKSTQNVDLPALLQPLMDRETYAVVLQNGLYVEQATEEVVGRGRIMGGCCFLCTNKVGPGHIKHLDYGDILLGAYRGCDGLSPPVPDTVLEKVVADFAGAGIPIQATLDLQASRWKKLMWNIPFNGLSVILNASTDRIMNNPSSRKLAEEVMREVLHAAVACGHDIPETHVEYLMDHTDKMVPYDSSMRLDYLASRPMELQAIFGNPLQAARQAGFEAVRIGMMYQQLSFLDHGRR